MSQKKTKTKIAEGKYFLMKKLLPSLDDDAEMEDDKTMTYEQWSKLEERKSLGDRRRSKELSFFEWVRCYHIFMSLRLQTAPAEVQGMLRHMEVVQDLYSQGKDAIAYDAKYRRIKDQHPSVPWGEYLAEVVNGLPQISRMGNGSRQPFRFRPQFNRPIQGGGFSRPARDQRPCTRFNSQMGCHMPNCFYSHKCGKCGIFGHPIHRCVAGRRR